MYAVLVGLVLAGAGDVLGGATLTAGAEVSSAGSAGGWGHVGLLARRDFDQAFLEVRGSVLLAGNLNALSLQDLGTTFTLGRRFDGFVQELRLEVMPFNGVRRLPLFDWANRLGTEPPTSSVAPTLALDVRTSRGQAWLATRLRPVFNALTQTSELRPDLFLGVDLALTPEFVLAARGGWMQYGLIPFYAQQGIGREARALSGALQLSWTWREPVGAPVDLVLYRQDPTRFERFFATEPRATPAAAWVAVEGGGATQLLADLPRFPGLTEQPAWWVDVQARVRLGELRLFATARSQSLSLVVFDAPSLQPFVALPQNNEVAPSVAGFLGADWRWAPGGLTPGILLSLSRHASATSSTIDFGGNPPPPGLPTSRTLLVTAERAFIILPAAEPVRPALSVRAWLRWEPAPFFTALLFVDVTRDWNRFEATIGGEVQPSDRIDVRGQLQLQARL